MVTQLHRELSAARAEGAQGADVAKHLRQWHVRGHDDRGAAGVLALHLAAAAQQVADDVAQRFGRRDDLDGHHGLQHHGRGLQRGLAQRGGRGQLEGEGGGVAHMGAAVHQRGFEVHQRVARERAGLGGLADARLHRRDELARDGAAHHGAGEAQARAARQRCHAQRQLGELAGAAALLLVHMAHLGRSGDRLAVGHLRPAHGHVHAEAGAQRFHRHLELQLAHAGEQGLAGVGVLPQAQRRVFAHEHAQALGEGRGAVLAAGFQRHIDHGLGHGDAFQQRRALGRGQRVAGQHVLQADEAGDVARDEGVALDAAVGVDLVQPRDALGLAGAGVPDRVATLQRAGVDAHEHHRAVVVGRELEGEGGEAVTRGVRAHHAGGFAGAREVVDDGVQQRLHAAVAEG
mmetsp:Transcript_9993/g.40487  ORF Transcript_9993/g.40487 Transcript_9993/m.40487 type:complete len:403 (-) Transcript_9993:631-1839(-)